VVNQSWIEATRFESRAGTLARIYPMDRRH